MNPNTKEAPTTTSHKRAPYAPHDSQQRRSRIAFALVGFLVAIGLAMHAIGVFPPA
jgi:hypothetical protein